MIMGKKYVFVINAIIHLCPKEPKSNTGDHIHLSRHKTRLYDGHKKRPYWENLEKFHLTRSSGILYSKKAGPVVPIFVLFLQDFPLRPSELRGTGRWAS